MAQDSRGIASVTSLKPYTTYMVTIALITKHGEGLHSDPLLNTTLEGGTYTNGWRVTRPDGARIKKTGGISNLKFFFLFFYYFFVKLLFGNFALKRSEKNIHSARKL